MKCAIFEEHSSSCVVYSRFSGTLFPVSMIDGDTAVVTAVYADQNFKWSKFEFSWQMHSHTLNGLGNQNHTESSPYVQDILVYG